MPEDRFASTWHYLPVEIPPGAYALRVELEYDPRGAVLDLGCQGPAGFRGWSGGARQSFVITASGGRRPVGRHPERRSTHGCLRTVRVLAARQEAAGLFRGRTRKRSMYSSVKTRCSRISSRAPSLSRSATLRRMRSW